jgi:hypothetical protein
MRAPMRSVVGPGGIPVASLELLALAVSEVEVAIVEPIPTRRYVQAHLVAVRAAAAVLAARARPTDSRGPRNVWSVLPNVAPEFREWAIFFASGAGKQAAAEAGLERAVTAREADDLVRDAHNFLDVVVGSLTRGATKLTPIAG